MFPSSHLSPRPPSRITSRFGEHAHYDASVSLSFLLDNSEPLPPGSVFRSANQPVAEGSSDDITVINYGGEKGEIGNATAPFRSITDQARIARSAGRAGDFVVGYDAPLAGRSASRGARRTDDANIRAGAANAHQSTPPSHPPLIDIQQQQSVQLARRALTTRRHALLAEALAKVGRLPEAVAEQQLVVAGGVMIGGGEV